MKHFVRAAAILLCLALLPALPCLAHGGKAMREFVMPETLDTENRYQLVFWAKNDTNITQRRIFEKAAADFEACYPNVTVTLTQYTDYREIYNDVIKNIPTRTTPNVCISYPDHIATYLTGRNVVVPLDGLMEDPRFGLGGSELRFDGVSAGGIIPKFLEEGKIDGVQYVLPFMRSSEACYINRDLVEKLGFTVPDVMTWDFIWQVSDAAMALGKDEEGNFLLNGQKTLIPFIYKSTDNMMIQYAAQKGSGYSDEFGRVQLFNDDTRAFLTEVSKHVENKAFSTFKIVSYPGNYFNAGQCIFAIDSTAGATWIGADAPLQDIPEDKKVHFSLLVRPVPQVDPANPVMISQGPSVCIFNKENPQEVLYAWLFAQFLLSDSVQIPYSRTEGYVPVTEDARRNPEYLDYLSRSGEDNDLYYSVKLDATRLVLDNVDNTFITPVFNGSASLREAAGELIEGTAKQIRRGKAVDDAFLTQLFSDTISLKRLNVDGLVRDRSMDLGPLPAGAVVLLCAMAVTWVGIGVYVLLDWLKRKKAKKTA